MINKIATGIVSVLLMFSFTACGADDGNVYDKQYLAAHYEDYQVDDYIQQPYYDTNTKSYQIRNVWIGTHTEQRYVSECYLVRFRNSDGDTGKDCIGEELYSSISIGDYYSK